MTYSFFHPQIKLMSQKKLDQIKKEYAQMVVEGMDMKLLIEFAEDSILENIKDYDYEDMKEEIEDIAGEEVWADLSAT
tara:strand:- start:9 stop:242 length:234 start_codon:yes stop_codon:yes gene_type:complete